MHHSTDPLLIVITGPTATGKTKTAAHLANTINGEIISADSRQVYRNMDLGTGKDLEDFLVDDHLIPYYLIDIKEPGYEYNVFEYLGDFSQAFNQVVKHNKQPILCGGTALYIDAVLSRYQLQEVPENPKLREKLSLMTMQELSSMLAKMRSLHNISDISDRQRLIRAIEIEIFQKENPANQVNLPSFQHIIFGIHFDRQLIRQRITQRLEARINQGMPEEIKYLLKKGLKPEQLTFYGLEYKYLTQYITGEISYSEMFSRLNTAIHQFAKRQMTWFRKMERKGFKINWIDGGLEMGKRINQMISIIENRHQ